MNPEVALASKAPSKRIVKLVTPISSLADALMLIVPETVALFVNPLTLIVGAKVSLPGEAVVTF